MLVENQKVQQKWSKRNKQWFINKGYTFTKFGDMFYVSPNDLTYGSHVKVNVECDYCGNIVSIPWKDYIKYRYDKYSCKHCRQKKTSEYNLKQRQDYLYNGALSVCEEKGYKLLTPKEDIKTAETRIEYLCNKHGINETKIYTLMLGHGCPGCSHEENANKKKHDADYIEERINEYGGILLNKNEYLGWNIKNLIVLCPVCNKPFITSYSSFICHDGQLCPDCTKVHSVGEKKIESYLNNHKIFFKQEYRFDDCRDKIALPFDFYLPDYNILIEYQGRQHYESINYFGGEEAFGKRMYHDNIKRDYCRNNNLTLLEIPYWDLNSIDIILDKALNLHDDIV